MSSRLSIAAGRLGAAAAPLLLLAACVSNVRLAPDAHGWQTGPDEATWRSDTIVVVTRLDTDAGPLPARGVIANTGNASVRITFVPDVASRGDAGLPDAAFDGVPFEVPQTFELGRGTISFALRPDEPWTDLPPEGAPISWTIVVTTPSGEVQCPLRFRVEDASSSLSPEVEITIASVLLVGASIALGYWFWF